MKYLLDTDICIHWLRGRKSVAESIDRHGLENCFISEITMAELLVGEQISIKRGRKVDSRRLKQLFRTIGVIPISGCIDFYALQKASLLDAGTPIEDFDLLIACTAVTSGMVLVSANTAHMHRVEGIRLENWFDGT